MKDEFKEFMLDYPKSIFEIHSQSLACKSLLDRNCTPVVWRLHELILQRKNDYERVKIPTEKKDSVIFDKVNRFLDNNGSHFMHVSSNTNALLCLNDKYITVNELLYVYEIKNNHQIPALRNRNQKGVKCTMDIPKHTILGVFDGFKWTDEEFDEINAGSYIMHPINCNAFDGVITLNDNIIKQLTNKEKQYIDIINFIHINDKD